MKLKSRIDAIGNVFGRFGIGVDPYPFASFSLPNRQRVVQSVREGGLLRGRQIIIDIAVIIFIEFVEMNRYTVVMIVR